MATRKRTVEIEVVVDDKNAQRDLKRIADNTTQTGKSFSTMGTLVKAGLAAFGAREMIQGLANLDRLRTQMEANETRSDVVFGNMADDVREWADEQNEAFGVGENALLGLASNVQDLLVPMGFARDEATGMSQDILVLANALDDWKGGTLGVEDATTRITKALLKEREGLIELGVKVTDADVKARLLANGHSELTGQALEQATAQATLEIITEKSADAMERYADRAGSAVAANKELKASTEDAKETAADFFGPVIDEGKEAFGDLAVIGGAAGDVIAAATGDAEGGWSKFISTAVRSAPVLGDIIRTLSGTADLLDDNTEATEAYSTATAEGAQVAMDADTALRNLHGATLDVTEANLAAAPSAEALAFAQEREAKAAKAARDATLAKRDALRQVHDPLFRAWKLSRDLEQADLDAAEAKKEHGRQSDEYIESAIHSAEVTADLLDTLRDLKDDGIDPTGAAARLMLQDLGVPDSVIDKIFKQFDRIERNFEDRLLEWNIAPLPPGLGGTDNNRDGFNAFHEGGVVPGTPGTNVPIIAQAGEHITRRAGVGTGGATTIVNYYPGTTIGNQHILEELVELARRRG